MRFAHPPLTQGTFERVFFGCAERFAYCKVLPFGVYIYIYMHEKNIGKRCTHTETFLYALCAKNSAEDDPVLAGRHTFLQLLPPIYWSLDSGLAGVVRC